MKNVLASIKYFAVAAGLLLGAGSSMALAAGRETGAFPQAEPTATPATTPTMTASPAATIAPPATLITIRGTACIDQDMNGLCAPSEARVPNVVVRGSAGAFAITDSSGQYALQVSPNSQIYIAIPAGFKSATGNLNHLYFQLAGPTTLDVALALDGAATTQQSSGKLAVPQDSSSPATSDAPAAIAAPWQSGWLVLAAVVIVSVGLAVLVVRQVTMKSVAQQNDRLHDEQLKALSDILRAPDGWQRIAGQILADALNRNVSVDESFGILNVSSEPAPRFTVVTRDFRVVIFTTGLRTARKARMIRKGDRVVDVTRRSLSSHTGASMLWQHATVERNMNQLSPPSAAHWYIIAQSGSKARRSRTPIVRHRSPVSLRRLVSYLGGRAQ